jgi:hypothetical protein
MKKRGGVNPVYTGGMRWVAVRWLTVIAVGVTLLQPIGVSALQVTARKVTLGSSVISTSTTHKFDFTTASTANIGAIQFLYCTTASGTCFTPAGLTTTSATLTAQTGTGATGFTIVAGTNGAPYITRTASSISATTAVSYTISTVTNPSTVNATFYVRITTFTATTPGGGGATDSGVVAASTAAQINVTAQVDEILAFCVYTGANCAAGGTSVDLGILTPSTTGTGVSYMDAGTNAGSGFAVQYNAPTLTSGGNTVPAIGSTATTSAVGSGQFGINATGPNTTPAVTGSQAPSGTAPIGTAATNYGTVDNYAFVASTPTTIASSTGPANTTKYSVSYLANINAAQGAGSYTATFTYICTATY